MPVPSSRVDDRVDDYADWYYSFYGRPAPFPTQPTLIPPPPDLAPVVARTAQFVAKHGPAAEVHLRRERLPYSKSGILHMGVESCRERLREDLAERADLQMDFLHPSHPYYAHYQMRVRQYQWEQSCAGIAHPPSSADNTGLVWQCRERRETGIASGLMGDLQSAAVSGEVTASNVTPPLNRRRRRLGFHEPPPEFRDATPPPVVTLVDLPVSHLFLFLPCW
jgi:hypothetical protein